MFEILKYLDLVREHKYPLVNEYFPLKVTPWEENLLLSRRTSNPELQTLLDQYLISTIWTTRLGAFDPKDFVTREIEYRTYFHYPPTTRFFEQSMISAYDEMIKGAGDKGLS
ncbi:MAG: hypothetical protein PHW73_09725, partial [Atribacterota bacterium]|nr:hypothetical protein [Atribacterota bacterium]